MVKRLIGVVAVGAATLFVGAVPAYAADNTASTTVATAPVTRAVTAKAKTAKYVEWSTTARYVEWSAPVKYVEWSAPATASRYVEW